MMLGEHGELGCACCEHAKPGPFLATDLWCVNVAQSGERGLNETPNTEN